MKHANRVVKNTMFLYMKMGITIFSSLYTTRLILQALGSNDFGIYSLVTGLISMLLFFNNAMSISSQRFMSYAKGKNDLLEEKSVFNVSFILHIAIAFLIVVLLESVGPFLFDHMLKIDPNRIDVAKSLYQFMILSTVFNVLSVPYNAVINANEDMLFVSLLGIFESFVKLAIAFYIVSMMDDKLYIFAYMMASLTFLLFLIKMLYSYQKYEEVVINFKQYLHKKIFNKMFHFASYTLLSISTQMITSYGSGLVLNMFFGTIVNAAQGIVTQVSGQLNAFAFTMLKALNPMITKSEGAGDRKLMLQASFVGSRMAFYLLILFYVPVMLEMPTIFNYWLVDVPKYTVVFGELMLVRNLIEQLYLTLYTSILSVGNIKAFQIYNAILNLAPLPIVYILFDKGFPPETIYVIFILYSLSQGSIYIYFAKKECGMSIILYFKEVVFKSLLSFIMIMMIVIIPHIFIDENFIRLTTVILVNIISFSFVMWFFGLEKVEKDFIINIFLKFRKKIGNKQCNL